MCVCMCVCVHMCVWSMRDKLRPFAAWFFILALEQLTRLHMPMVGFLRREHVQYFPSVTFISEAIDTYLHIQYTWHLNCIQHKLYRGGSYCIFKFRSGFGIHSHNAIVRTKELDIRVEPNALEIHIWMFLCFGLFCLFVCLFVLHYGV